MRTIDVRVLDVDEGDVAMLNDGRQIALVLLLEQQLHESLDDVHFHIATVVARYQHLSFGVEYEYRWHRHFILTQKKNKNKTEREKERKDYLLYSDDENKNEK